MMTMADEYARKIVKACAEEFEEHAKNGTLKTWLDDALDIEVTRAGLTPDGDVRGVNVMVAASPNVFVNTREEAVMIYWGTSGERYPLSSEACCDLENWIAEIC